ncbi:hypothetical protein TWF281_006873 [Arthrobotrys megalospora]
MANQWAGANHWAGFVNPWLGEAVLPQPQLPGANGVAGNPPQNHQPAPAILYDFTAADFIDFWMSKPAFGAPYDPLTFLGARANFDLNGSALNLPSPNPCLRTCLVESDVRRFLEQLLLPSVERMAYKLVEAVSLHLNPNRGIEIKSNAESNFWGHRIDIAWVAKYANGPEIPILFLEIKPPRTIDRNQFAWNFQMPPAVPGFPGNEYEIWRAAQTRGGGAIHPSITYDLNHLNGGQGSQPSVDSWRNLQNRGNARNIIQQAATNHYGNANITSVRVPRTIIFDYSSMCLLDWNRTTNLVGGVERTLAAEALEDEKAIGFAYLNPEVFPGAGVAQVVESFGLLLVSALFAGVYDQFGWQF